MEKKSSENNVARTKGVPEKAKSVYKGTSVRNWMSHLALMAAAKTESVETLKNDTRASYKLNESGSQ